ncbi:MAG: hypothetical protein QM733_14270 [Ilumatobacteraceae bacterium]
MTRRVARLGALVIAAWSVFGAVAGAPTNHHALAAAAPQQVDTWAWCGVDPDLPQASLAVEAMAVAAGIDATFGPCKNMDGKPYTPANPGDRYVQPDVYMRLVQLNASVGMKTIVYDARLWSTVAQDRATAIAFWQPVLGDIAAWDMGDEFDPATKDWDTLKARWTIMRTYVEPATGVRPFTNVLPSANVLTKALTDLPGSERLLSFAQYWGDLGVGLAKQFASQATLMCAVNEYDHMGYVATPDSIRSGMTTLVAAGCDQILVFGGYPVSDDPTHVFGTQSLVDTDGSPTDFAAATQEGSGHSSLVALRPQRLLETRVGAGLGTVDGQFNGTGPLAANGVLALAVVGRADVPEWARSVVLNVTVTGATGPGFLTVYPCDQPQPWSSNLNYDVGVTRAVTVVAQLGRAGDVCVYTRAATHVVVDLTGYFPSGASFEGAQPARALETRVGAEFTTVDGVSVGLGRLAGGSVTPITMAGRAGLPDDVKAVAVNLTIVGPAMDGFATLFPCGDPVPLASTVNFASGKIVSNAAIVEVGDGGSICLFSNVETDAVVDVNGYDAATSVVQFMTPARLLETRSGQATADHLFEGIGRRAGDSVLELQIGGRLGVPADIRAAVLNITVTDTQAAGFITVYPCDGPRPIASTLNYDARATVANLAVATTTVDGKVCIYAQRATDLVVDLSGYHT